MLSIINILLSEAFLYGTYHSLWNLLCELMIQHLWLTSKKPFRLLKKRVLWHITFQLLWL